jgi:hypothetical protein
MAGGALPRWKRESGGGAGDEVGRVARDAARRVAKRVLVWRRGEMRGKEK